MLRNNTCTPNGSPANVASASDEIAELSSTTSPNRLASSKEAQSSQVLDYANPDQEQIDLNQATTTYSRGDLDGVFERKGASSASVDLDEEDTTTATATSKTKSFQNVQKLHNSPPSRLSRAPPRELSLIRLNEGFIKNYSSVLLIQDSQSFKPLKSSTNKCVMLGGKIEVVNNNDEKVETTASKTKTTVVSSTVGGEVISVNSSMVENVKSS